MNQLGQIDELKKSDYDRGFLQLLEQLTSVESEKISYDDFCKHYDNINNKIYVIRNISTNKIVASGSIFIEKKFIHNLSSVGHIEDIIVDSNYRGFGLGKVIINHLTNVAKNNGCYKVILNCSNKNVGFYEKCGFVKKETEMVKYFT